MTEDITVNGLTKRYGEKTVLSNFSHCFPAGETTCLMGPSGCGKTTLLRLLMGLELPDAGSIRGVPERISAVFQEDRLCEEFNPVTNIRLAVGKRVPEAVIRRELELLGLGGSLKAPVRELSGGMKRRVALVRAMLALKTGEEALFLDEPFKGLDAQLRQKVAAYVRERAEGRTVIVVTHDAGDVELLGGKLLTMEVYENESDPA